MAIAEAGNILVVAAEGRELVGILRHCRRRARLAWHVPFARSGELGGRRLSLVAHGCGAALAGEACEIAWNKLRADVIISSGFCGALDPALRAGDILAASCVEKPDGSLVLPVRQPECSLPHSSGRLVSVDHVVQTVEEKKWLRERGASAVEMEALAVALRARQWGVPFYCVRAVTDLAEEGFQLDFNEARDSQGRLSTARILWAALRRPHPLASELLRLYYRGHWAARALGDFFAGCRF